MFFFVCSSWSRPSFTDLDTRFYIINCRRFYLCWYSALSRLLSSWYGWFNNFFHSNMFSFNSHTKIIYWSLILSFFSLFFCNKISCSFWKSKWLIFLNRKFVNLLFKSNPYIRSLRKKSSLLLLSTSVFFCLTSNIMNIYSFIQSFFKNFQIVRFYDYIRILFKK